MAMDLKLSDEQLQQLVSTALLKAMSPEDRDALFAKAIGDLLQRDTGNSYDKRPRVMRILDEAVQQVARKMIADWLERDPEAQSKIRAVYSEAFEMVFVGEHRTHMVEAIVSGIDRALRGDRY